MIMTNKQGEDIHTHTKVQWTNLPQLLLSNYPFQVRFASTLLTKESHHPIDTC